MVGTRCLLPKLDSVCTMRTLDTPPKALRAVKEENSQEWDGDNEESQMPIFRNGKSMFWLQ